MAAAIRLARVYDSPTLGAARVLVDRLWPRGIRKEALALDLWAKDLAPSDGLRRWFHADPSQHAEFVRRYRAELAGADFAAVSALCARGPAVFLTAAKEPGESHAAVLREVMAERSAGGSYASPVCYAAELAPDYFGADPQQALDVARWRKAERTRLLAERAALSVAARQAVAAALAGHLDALLERRFGGVNGRTVSAYWPIKGEPDLRPWMEALHEKGARLALPVVEVPRAPLVFRPWAPGAAMERGHWNILVPATAETVIPQIALAPLVGWDGEGYRLGYGGGYFDRTLAALQPRPFVIGVGVEAARLATIFPQPHDIGLDAIITETGLRWERAA